MGASAEKVLRLVVCEELKEQAPGVTYNAAMLASLEITDPWRDDPNYEAPPIEFIFGRLKEQSGKIVEAWDTRLAA
ncbi:hypothetical protein [Methylocystis sp. B8]|uniref:hypothetical protein n=1 Tax=Methylocystis sp. B8 TaxID=544938 RepID=UPI0010FE6618|nr:hypothetical protein [Methylocystis sp. B8]TLG75165.1 hypothetical protein FEV16_11695 [Methylocystis sp. B8]